MQSIHHLAVITFEFNTFLELYVHYRFSKMLSFYDVFTCVCLLFMCRHHGWFDGIDMLLLAKQIPRGATKVSLIHDRLKPCVILWSVRVRVFDNQALIVRNNQLSESWNLRLCSDLPFHFADAFIHSTTCSKLVFRLMSYYII